jgi:hypothetical protein
MSQAIQHRDGETSRPPFRRNRVYRSDDQWFFLTRAGRPKGPYNSEKEVQTALERYLTTLGNLHKAFHKLT